MFTGAACGGRHIETDAGFFTTDLTEGGGVTDVLNGEYGLRNSPSGSKGILAGSRRGVTGKIGRRIPPTGRFARVVVTGCLP